MSIRKRNEYLEGEEDEDASGGGYDSEAVEESRVTISAPARKRQKLSDASNDDDFDASASRAKHRKQPEDVDSRFAALLDDQDDGAALDDDVENDESPAPTSSLKISKAPKHVAAAQKAARRSGVVYISRVPPFMKPQTLKHFLAPHAPKGLGRIFLTPEDHVAHSRRVKKGGNKKKSFTDGWVEFVSKREAKTAAETLNGNIIGGKKGNFYHDDLWSMKYLKGFKWSHLTEQIANENAERAARMREEVRKTKQENKAFVDDIERGKMLEGMETKRKMKQARGGSKAEQPVRKGMTNDFKQKSARRMDDGTKLSEQATKVQRLIF
ncbi:RNA-binding ATPase activator esf2 [Saxophila tyrrhenica]|uniref:18S rRNA factor 2 n=1 Tax=Saxophila tyrrhenica TaxID=1690608 RepID=A0AAV9NZR9_9PEZI|nr:RNA-binding ATPase activator esf2 [Saxophila tyrrhenica]